MFDRETLRRLLSDPMQSGRALRNKFHSSSPVLGSPRSLRTNSTTLRMRRTICRLVFFKRAYRRLVFFNTTTDQS